MFHFILHDMDEEGLFPMRGRGGLPAAVRAMFANGEPGAVYDPTDFSTSLGLQVVQFLNDGIGR